MKKSIQKGFTLIELMIVVAIIGILAAFAIPAYNDYITRTQVSEAVELLAGIKTPAAQYYGENASWPTLVAADGKTEVPAGSIAVTMEGKYADIKALTGTGAVATITAEMKAGRANVDDKKTVALKTEDGGSTWKCNKDAGTTVETKYLPNACK